MAHLLIHSTCELQTGATHFGEKMRQLLSLIRTPTNWPVEHANLRLEVKDGGGLPVFVLDDAGPLVDVPLPAGIYHLSAHFGDARRGYTMVLGQGATVNLYLVFAPDR